jgi:hypothetical protein
MHTWITSNSKTTGWTWGQGNGVKKFLPALNGTMEYIDPQTVKQFREPERNKQGGSRPYSMLKDYKGNDYGIMFISKIDMNIWLASQNGGWETGCSIPPLLAGFLVVVLPSVSSPDNTFGLKYTLKESIS